MWMWTYTCHIKTACCPGEDDYFGAVERIPSKTTVGENACDTIHFEWVEMTEGVVIQEVVKH